MEINARSKGIIFTSIAAILWGTSYPLIKWTMNYASPYLLVTIRFLLASVVLFPFAVLIDWNSLVEYFGTPQIVILGVINGVGYFLQFVGQAITTATKASLLLNTSAIFAAVFSYFFLNERIGRKKALGIILTFVGIFLIVTEGKIGKLATGSIVGDLLCLIGGGLWGLYTVISKMTSDVSINSLSFTASMLLYTAVSVTLFSLPRLNCISLHFTVWIGILYLSVFCTVIPFLLWYRGLKKIEASTSAILLLLMIVVSALISILFLNEPFNVMIGTGAVFICGGIWITEKQFTSSTS